MSTSRNLCDAINEALLYGKWKTSDGREKRSVWREVKERLNRSSKVSYRIYVRMDRTRSGGRRGRGKMRSSPGAELPELSQFP
jgi:hypothetical protein